MSHTARGLSSHLTLALCTLLHGFTHAFSTLLVPLYLLIQHDLQLHGVRPAGLLVTIYGLVYCAGSYAAGLLADRFSRKWLLAIGQIGNALAIVGMALTHDYSLLVVLSVLAGLFGTLFHPSANALVPAHYPRSPGMAIGLLGMGAGLGFCLGPIYAGWRGGGTHNMWGISQWQAPLLEMGLFGLAFGLIFILLASEATAHRVKRVPMPTPRGLRRRVILLALVLGWRDFAGVAGLTLASLFLQKAHGYTVPQAGTTVALMMLLGVAANPLAVWLSPGARRLPGLVVCLVFSAAWAAAIPLFPGAWLLLPLCLMQTSQLASYAVSDAAILERVPDAYRGRVVGVFLVVAGTLASSSPFVISAWIDALGAGSAHTAGYVPIFLTLAAMLLVACASLPLIAALGRVKAPEVQPAGLPASTPAALG